MILPPIFFFFNDTATTEIYTLSLHDALPIYIGRQMVLLYWAVTHLPRKPDDPEDRTEYRYVKLYQQASEQLEKDETLKREIEALTQRFEGGDVRLTKDIRKVGEAILGSILQTLRRVNVAFDSFFWESDASLDGSVQRVIDRLS